MRGNRNVRTVRPVTGHDIDDQLWPINAMLFIFSCSVTAVIVTAGIHARRFTNPLHDPQPLFNGWVHVGILSVIVIGFIIITVTLRRNVSTRRMQLSILLAIMAQFIQAVILYHMRMPDSEIEPKQVVSVTDEIEQNWRKIRDLSVPLLDDSEQTPKDPLDEPTNDPTPDPLPKEQPRQRIKMAELAKQELPKPETKVEPRPNQRPMKKAAVAQARQSRKPGGVLSRTDSPDRRVATAVAAATRNVVEAVSTQKIQSRSITLARRETENAQLKTRPSKQPATQIKISPRMAQITRPQPKNSQPIRTARLTTRRKAATDQKLERMESPTLTAAEQIRAEADPSSVPAARAMRVDATQVAAAKLVQSSQPLSSQPQSSHSLYPSTIQRAATAEQPVASPMTRQLAARSFKTSTPSADVAAVSVQASAVRSTTTKPGLQASSVTTARRNTADAANLSATATAQNSPASITSTRRVVSAPRSQRRTDRPRVGTTSTRPRSEPTKLAAGGSPTATTATSVADAPVAAPGPAGTTGLRAASTAVARSNASGSRSISFKTNAGGNVTSQKPLGLTTAGATRATPTQRLSPGASGGSGRAMLMTKSSTGQLSGGSSSAAIGTDAAVVTSQGQPGGVEAAPRGNAAGRYNLSPGVAALGKSEPGGGPTRSANSGSPTIAGIGRKGGSTTGQPTIRPAGSALKAGRSSGGLDAPLAAQMVASGRGAKTASQSEGTVIEARSSAAKPGRGQAVATTLGKTETSGGPAGTSSGAAPVGSVASRANSGTQGSPTLGSSGKTPGRISRSSGGGLSGNPTALSAAGASPSDRGGTGPSGPAARSLARVSAKGASFGRGKSGAAGPAGMTGALSGTIGGIRRATDGPSGVPVIAKAGAVQLKRASGHGLPSGPAVADDSGPVAGADRVVGSGNPGPAARKATRGEANQLLVRVNATAGPGGTTNNVQGKIGSPSRAARPDSDLVQTNPRRFQLQKATASLSVNTDASAVIDPFEKRRALRNKLEKGGGGTPDYIRAVEAGLEFLARHQRRDGRWVLHDFDIGKNYRLQANEAQLGSKRTSMHSDTAATGLALLAFLGAGYTHQQGNKYHKLVKAGLDYLRDHQKPNGDLYFNNSNRKQRVWLYSHGIASIALCEAYGMTHDPALKKPAQKALDFIVYAQSKQGGWRYEPKVGSDTSVSGWQVIALKSGQLADLQVPKSCLDRVNTWLGYAKKPGDPTRFIYNRTENDPYNNSGTVPTMTAEGLLMRLYLGRGPRQTSKSSGARLLNKHLPDYSKELRNCYYWYYATNYLYHVGGSTWNTWSDHLNKLLIERQEQKGPVGDPSSATARRRAALRGSWDPLGRAPNRSSRGPDRLGRGPDRWGLHAGRIYVTTMHLLMLEVNYRSLPLYGDAVTKSE